jgi:thymidylate synthase (FAD)
VHDVLEHQQREVYRYYDTLCTDGVAKEVARLNTPVSRYSKMRAKTDLRNWLGFLQLRLAPNAQWEIRQYAEAVAAIVAQLWPRTWALFEEHDLGAVHLSATDARALADLLDSTSDGDEDTLDRIRKILKNRIDPANLRR